MQKPTFLWIPVTLFALATLPHASLGQEAPAEGASPLESVLSAAGGKPVRLFENGAQVELLAIGTHGEGEQQWWTPSGKRLKTAPFESRGASNVTPVPDRQLVFRTSRLNKGASVRRSVSSSSRSSSAALIVDGVRNPPGYYSHVFDAPKDDQPFTLKVGVAQGAWTTYATNQGGNMALTRLNNWALFSGGLVNESGDAAVVLTHNISDVQVRLVAADQAGKTYAARLTAAMGAGGFTQSTFEFRGLEPAEVDRVQVQTRPYEWVEFTDLPATPDSAG